MGEPWRDAGRMTKKMNTFTDFIAAAEHLIAEDYTSKDRGLKIQGRVRLAADRGGDQPASALFRW